MEPSASKALLLTTNTEVSIAPKVRAKGKSPPGASQSKVQALSNGDAKAEQSFNKSSSSEKKCMRVFRVVPSRVFPSMNVACSSLEDGEVAAVAYVAKNALRSVMRDVHGDGPQTTKNWKATARRLTPPADPTQSQQGGNTMTPVIPIAKILVPSDSAASKNARIPSISKDEILVTWSPDVPVPDGLVVLHGIVEGVEDWDLVK